MTEDSHPDRPPAARVETVEEFCSRIFAGCECWIGGVKAVEQRDAQVRSAALDEAAELSKRYLPGSYVGQNMQAVAAVRAYRDGIRALTALPSTGSTGDGGGQV
jgi:hypothetical protein